MQRSSCPRSHDLNGIQNRLEGVKVVLDTFANVVNKQEKLINVCVSLTLHLDAMLRLRALPSV